MDQRLDSKACKEHLETQPSKKRKIGQKTVVAVKLEEKEGKQKNSEGPPSDCWSWRKYGQKPIKGSPYPRGYYKCSTSKACSAKKQVERCRTDSTMLIITYSSTHNHPGPKETQAHPTSPKQEQKQDQEAQNTNNDEIPPEKNNFHYSQSPFSSSQEEHPFNETLENTTCDSSRVVFVQEPLAYPHQMTFSTPKSEENDFYDELEELPTYSSFITPLRSNFFEERVLVHPS